MWQQIQASVYTLRLRRVEFNPNRRNPAGYDLISTTLQYKSNVFYVTISVDIALI